MCFPLKASLMMMQAIVTQPVFLLSAAISPLFSEIANARLMRAELSKYDQNAVKGTVFFKSNYKPPLQIQNYQ
jgi:hypothetical protein